MNSRKKGAVEFFSSNIEDCYSCMQLMSLDLDAVPCGGERPFFIFHFSFNLCDNKEKKDTPQRDVKKYWSRDKPMFFSHQMVSMLIIVESLNGNCPSDGRN